MTVTLTRPRAEARTQRGPRSRRRRDATRPGPRLRTLVIGLGNPLVTDDSVGLRVVAELRHLLGERPDIDLAEDYWGGLRLMERMIGYERAVVIDAICTGAKPGTLHELSTESLPTQRSASAHDVNLPTALAFGRRAGVPLPEDRHIRLLAIEAADVLTFGDTCTPGVEAAIPGAVAGTIRILHELTEGSSDDLS